MVRNHTGERHAVGADHLVVVTEPKYVSANNVGRALESLLKPDKLNIAALGNVVPQLHVHLIARFTTDAAWPQPVWGQGTRVAYDETALAQRIAELRNALRTELA